MVISELLEDHFKNLGCNTFLLPMVIDTQKVDLGPSLGKENGVINMIYQGNPCREDFVTMLKAMVYLKESGEDGFVFHITGVRESDVRAQLKNDAVMFNRLGDNIVFHGWIDYEELQSLFHKMDYLFMSRKCDIVRKANFPSKLPECMARGIIPICNKVGDYWKYLSDKDSILFGDSNVQNCVNSLRKAMSLSAKELNNMKNNAVLCAQEYFDYRVWVEKLNEYLTKL